MTHQCEFIPLQTNAIPLQKKDNSVRPILLRAQEPDKALMRTFEWSEHSLIFKNRHQF